MSAPDAPSYFRRPHLSAALRLSLAETRWPPVESIRQHKSALGSSRAFVCETELPTAGAEIIIQLQRGRTTEAAAAEVMWEVYDVTGCLAGRSAMGD